MPGWTSTATAAGSKKTTSSSRSTATTPTRSRRRCGSRTPRTADVLVVSIGPERVTQALRTALGMGADRAIHVKDPATEGSDALGIAKILAAIAKQESPDLVFMGLMADDGNFASVPPMLAELAGIPHATGAVAVSRSNGTFTVDREIDGGASEVVELETPCLISVQTGPEPGPLCVAQGDHGGEEEAARREDRRRSRASRARSARARRRSRSRRSRRPRRATAPRSCPAPPMRWWPGS